MRTARDETSAAPTTRGRSTSGPATSWSRWTRRVGLNRGLPAAASPCLGLSCRARTPTLLCPLPALGVARWCAGRRVRSFNDYLRNHVGRYPSRCQEDSCGRALFITKRLSSVPHVYSLVIAHESANASSDEIQRTLTAVEDTIDINAIYGHGTEASAQPCCARLRHINAFALAHYVAFTWDEVANYWLLRDDAVCKVVGPSFEDVVKKCVANRYQPGLLFYDLEM